VSAQPMIVTTGTADPDGINHWWTYEEDALGGVGKYMVNVANGNLISQSDDMAVPNKGIEFAFRRTYNSMSNHTYANSDGSTPALYGDRWTNTFDAHIAYNNLAPVNGQNGVSLYDIDGARYDYAPVGDGHSFIPPAGQFAILYFDGTGYSWTKKSGTVYYFWDINQPANHAGYSGQIEIIYGRNRNNYLSFTRSYTGGDASKATNIASIVVSAEDGRTATLTFGDVSQSGSPNYRVLQSITWPDGTTAVTFGYTIQFQGSTPIGPTLTQVTSPGNGSTTSGKLNEQYNYSAGTASLINVYSPRYYCSHNSDCNSTQNPIPTGPAYTFSYGTGGVLSQVGYYGDVNPSITDSSGTGYLQPNSTHDLGTTTAYRTASYSYSSGSTTWSDSDGHQSVYVFDSIGRVTQTTETTGDPVGGVATLVVTGGWDASNNFIFSTDPRGNETDYAYDNTGNTIEVAQPLAPNSVNGSLVSMRPTAIYSYDTNNNITAYCDPVWAHANGKDWATRPAPSDSLCPAQAGTTVLTWTEPGSYEPFGELTQLVQPLGFSSVFAYATGPQGGADFGLPTSVTGTSFLESDGTNVTPQQSFVYDAHGNVICYSNGVGTWIIQYDALMRRTAVGDPDDASLTSTSCAKTPGLPGSFIRTTLSYLPNGQMTTTQTPSEHAAGVSTGFTYDADGNEIGESHHYGGNLGTTTKLYDGSDRLVEVVLPHDSSSVGGKPVDYFSYPWTTRNYYDLTQGGQPNLSSLTGQTLSVTAHGGLYAVGMWAPTYNGNGGLNAPAWWATKAYAYDALDRTVQRYTAIPPTIGTGFGSVPFYAETLSTYDASSLPGLLVTTARMKLGSSGGTISTYSYDAISRFIKVSFSDATPSETYTYDPDSREVSIQSSLFGTLSYAYDTDGRLVTEGEPSGGGLTSAATYTHRYYPNGWNQSLDIASSSLTQTGLFVDSFRADGKLEQEKFAYAGNTSTFSSTYTPGGRALTMTDPFYAPAHSYTYDVAGRVSTYAIPSMTMSSFVYDPENDISSFSYPNGSVSNSYNVRGELYNGLGGLHQSANGVPIGAPNVSGAVPDAVSGVIAATLNINDGTWNSDFQYDAIGRLSGVTAHGTYITGSESRRYDAEDHLTSSSYTTWPCPDGQKNWPGKTVRLSYGWGPNGHPILASATYPSGSYTETLHWIGGKLLFTTNVSGQLDDIKVGPIAEVVPTSTVYNGLTVLDRDLSGRMLSAHNSTGYGSWETTSISPGKGSTIDGNTCDNPDGQPHTGVIVQIDTPKSTNFKAAAPPGIYEPTSDAVADGHSTFHGTRDINGATGTWSTPDAFDGSIHDPISQRSYMYARNNPVSYADPTGFIPMIPLMAPNPTEFGYDIADLGSERPDVPKTKNDWSNLQPGKVVTPSEDVDLQAAQKLFGDGAAIVAGMFAVIEAVVPGGAEVRGAKAAWVVYTASKDGKIFYVGITANITRRSAEQLKRFGVTIEPIEAAGRLTKNEARGVEQALINAYGLAKNGGQLVNKINSIRNNTEVYKQFVPFGEALLHDVHWPGF
jgi:YD repeat-containing protein